MLSTRREIARCRHRTEWLVLEWCDGKQFPNFTLNQCWLRWLDDPQRAIASSLSAYSVGFCEIALLAWRLDAQLEPIASEGADYVDFLECRVPEPVASWVAEEIVKSRLEFVA